MCCTVSVTSSPASPFGRNCMPRRQCLQHPPVLTLQSMAVHKSFAFRCACTVVMQNRSVQMDSCVGLQCSGPCRVPMLVLVVVLPGQTCGDVEQLLLAQGRGGWSAAGCMGGCGLLHSSVLQPPFVQLLCSSIVVQSHLDVLAPRSVMLGSPFDDHHG